MKTPRHLAGAPCWAELCTADVAAAHAFYRDLFGWDGAAAGKPFGPYVVLTLRGESVGGIKLTSEDPSSIWEVYFSSEDLIATSDAVAAGGGRVVRPPTRVFDRGSSAYYVSPDGAEFGAWQPDAHAGVGLMWEHGAPAWFELGTPHTDLAAAFYTDVFGWKGTRHAIGASHYIDLEPRSGKVPFGGITPNVSGMATQWTPYFTARDTDAVTSRAVQGGGSVILAPRTLPSIGRIATLRDPQGAAFSVITRPGQ